VLLRGINVNFEFGGSFFELRVLSGITEVSTTFGGRE
jgi:hypothetical protein